MSLRPSVSRWSGSPASGGHVCHHGHAFGLTLSALALAACMMLWPGCTSPSDAPDVGARDMGTPLRACYVADTSRVVKLSYPARETLGIWPVPDDEWVVDFDVDVWSGLVYATTMAKGPQSSVWRNGVRVCSRDGPSRLIWADSATEYLAFYRIRLSPSGTHAALQACIYLEFHYLVVVDLRSGAATPFYCADVDHKQLLPLAWDSGSTHLYARRLDWWSSDLVELDINAGTWRPLVSHDIRDYVPEERLLAQGVSPGGFRYSDILGVACPATVEWSPSGEAFVYADERWGECCLLYDVAAGAKDVVAIGPIAPYRYCPVVHGEWDVAAVGQVPAGACTLHTEPSSIPPGFLDTVSVLNPCAAFRIVCSSGPPAALELSWTCTALADSLPRAHYVLRARADAEMAHLCELDYLLRMLGHRVQARIAGYAPWWDYCSAEPQWTQQQLADSARVYLQALDTLGRAYRSLVYPAVLEGEKALFDSLVARRYRFEYSLMRYVETDSVTALKDSLGRIFPPSDTAYLQEQADRMAATTYRDRYALFDKRVTMSYLVPALSEIDSTLARYRAQYQVEPTYYEQTGHAYWEYSLDGCW